MSEIFRHISLVKEVYSSMQTDLSEIGYQLDRLLTEYMGQLPKDVQKRIIRYPVHRIKDEKSVINNIFFRKSVQRTEPEDALFDLKDKVATRIILLTEDDVNLVTELLQSKADYWNIRIGRELDKALQGGFDYRAIHIYITPKPSFLPQFADKSKKYLSRFVCEVQIRTNLQHTLAEVQHSITYKTPYALDGELEKKLTEAYDKIKSVDDFICNLFQIRENLDVSVQQLMIEITNLYIQLRLDLRGQAGEKLQKERIKESDHQLNALIFQVYAANKINTENVFKVCEKHWKDIEYLVNSDAVLSREPIVVLLAYLFFTQKYTLRKNWVLSEDLLEEIYHHLGAAFE